MATTPVDIVASAKSDLDTLAKQEQQFAAAVMAKKKIITDALTAHMAAHQAQAAAHTNEVTAAQSLINQATGVVAGASQPATPKLLLTQLKAREAGVAAFFARNWRYFVAAVIVGLIVYHLTH